MKKPDRYESILLVDDEKDIRDVLEISLSDSGYKVLTAENGDEALRIFKETNPPIVLTDIKMPVMDGIELLKKIKHENTETEVIMITGHGDMDLAVDSLKHEATDFITKPINVDVLEIALKKVEEKILIRRKLQEYTESLERLVREKTELQDRLSSLGYMIASISHGIKGLLTGLDGGIYILESGLSKKNQDKIVEGFKDIKLVSSRIKKMILDILYYAKERPIVEQDGNLILVDDERMPEELRKTAKKEMVRFRTLGCYPLTGAINSTAITLPEIIKEMLLSTSSEREGRVIDKDQEGAMELKKIEGYF